MTIQIINGPNLNLLGAREPEIYGTQGFNSYLGTLRAAFPGVRIDYFQSNGEGALIDKLQAAGRSADGIVLNAGGYSHTSVALLDCIRAIPAPVIEVHLSNIFAREPFRRTSLLAPACRGVIAGLGLEGYRAACQWIIHNA